MNWRSNILKNCDLNYLYLFLYCFLFLFFTSFLSPLFDYNTWCDVNVYNAIGLAIVDGKTLYVDVFDHKGPLLYFLYTTNSHFNFSHFFGVFLFEIFVFTLYLIYIYKLLRIFISSPSLCFFIAVLFPFLYLFYSLYEGSPEDFILSFQAIFLFYFVRYLKSEQNWTCNNF